MSNSCFQACTVVFIYCAVLFVHINVSVSARDSRLSKTRHIRSDKSLVLDRLYENHPSLRDAALTSNMRSLLISLNRKKRILHHGRKNKIWRTTLVHLNHKKTTREPPLIDVNDIESPIIRQKHQCKAVLSKADIEFDDLNRKSISLVRRAAVTESTTKNTLMKRDADGTTPFQMPVVVTEVVEVRTQPSTVNINEGTFQRRQAGEEIPTTCITVTGVETTTPNLDTLPNVETPTVPVTLPQPPPPPPPPPPAEPPPPPPPPTEPPTLPPLPSPELPAGPRILPPPVAGTFATQNSAAAAYGPQTTVTGVYAFVPNRMSDTLSEILENVESLADQKSTGHEDFPCEVNGSWISEAGGVRLEIKLKSNGSLDIEQGETYGKSKKRLEEGFLANSTWKLCGVLPLEKKSMIIINGVNENDNRVATFIGECKVCHRTETIAGHWLEVNTARDCNDQKDSFKILSDLWRREVLHTLKKQRMQLRNETEATTSSTTKKGEKPATTV